MKRYSPISIIIALLTILTIPYSLIAQEESTSSGTIDQIREAVKQKVEEKIGQITQRDLGIVAQVKDINEQRILIHGIDFQDYTLKTTPTSEYFRLPGKRPIEREDIALEDHILVIGTQITGEENIEVKNIQIISQPEIPAREVTTGTVNKINKNNFIITSGEDTWTIGTSVSSEYYIFENGKATLDKTKQLNVDDYTIAIGTLDDKEDNTIKSNLIFKVPN